MSEQKTVNKTAPPIIVSVLELSHTDARSFFLQGESYCSLDLPPYITFDKVLLGVNKVLSAKNLKGLSSSKPQDYDDNNYTILSNKDGKYAWRPLQLIHPALYVSLVHRITEESNWRLICDCFKNFSDNHYIRCLSLPVTSQSNENNKAEQIFHWWQEVEQRSIELSLEYEYLLETDITDCYGSIYTHSIAWALHTKEESKKQENKDNHDLIGNVIDRHIRDMCHGQTNGIPQGSVLMDFIAEVVLGYADLKLSERIKQEDIGDYYLLRYRDDYRIFVNNPQCGESILKLLTEVTIDLGLKMSPSKTKASNDVVRASIKSEKLAWIGKKNSEVNLQKHLLIIHDHAKHFPNAGSLAGALGEYHKRITENDAPIDQLMSLVAIVVDIAYRNPRTYSICAAILSIFLNFINTEEKKAVVERIRRKFKQIPNTGHMQIWLQRVTLPFTSDDISYAEPLCKLVAGEEAQIWNNKWISSSTLKNAVNSKQIVDQNVLREIQPIIPSAEVELFITKFSDRYYE